MVRWISLKLTGSGGDVRAALAGKEKKKMKISHAKVESLLQQLV